MTLPWQGTHTVSSCVGHLCRRLKPLRDASSALLSQIVTSFRHIIPCVVHLAVAFVNVPRACFSIQCAGLFDALLYVFLCSVFFAASPLNYRGFPKSCCTYVSSSPAGYCSCKRLNKWASTGSFRTPVLVQVQSPLLMLAHASFFQRSVNEVICHGIPDNYPLKDGDIVNGTRVPDILCYLRIGALDCASLFLALRDGFSV